MVLQWIGTSSCGRRSDTPTHFRASRNSVSDFVRVKAEGTVTRRPARRHRRETIGRHGYLIPEPPLTPPAVGIEMLLATVPA